MICLAPQQRANKDTNMTPNLTSSLNCITIDIIAKHHTHPEWLLYRSGYISSEIGSLEDCQENVDIRTLNDVINFV